MNEPQIDPRTGQPLRRNNPWMIVLIVVGACGGVGVVLIAVLAALLFPVFASARDAARKASCISNMKQLNTALLMYANDYDEHYPVAKVWQTSIAPYLPTEPRDICGSRPETVPGYAFNARISGVNREKIVEASSEPVLFESSLGKPNGSDHLQSFVMPHRNTGVVGFADGTARAVEAPPASVTGRGSP